MGRTGAVIPAAGVSYHGDAFRPLLPFEDTTVARHLVSLLKREGVDPIVVVTGYRAAELEEHLAQTGVLFLRNEAYETTKMFDSVRMGIRTIAGACDRILVIPADMPAIQPQTIHQILRIGSQIVRTVYGGKPGHPVLLRTDIALQLCGYEGERGLRGAMESSGIDITDLTVDDKGVSWDIDSQEEYQKMIHWNFRRGNGYPIRPDIHVRLAAGEVFFERETAGLLESVERMGSIQEACLQMDLSYSKGRAMIRKVEKQLGCRILERWAGGSGGGGAHLTQEGKNLLRGYRAMQEQVQNDSIRAFSECFAEGMKHS